MPKKNKFVARREREQKQATLVRNIAIAIVLIVVLLIGYGYIDQIFIQQQKAVATVNEEKITISQFQARVRLDRENLINQYLQYAQMAQFGMDVESQLAPIENRLSQPVQIGQEILETMINELIYRQEAEKLGFTVSEEDVEKEMRTFLQYFPEGTPTVAPSATPFVLEISTLSPEQLELVTITPTATEAPASTPSPTVAPTEEEEDADAEDVVPTVEAIPTFTATPYTLEGYETAYEETLPFYTDLGLTEEDFRALFVSHLYYLSLYDEVTADISRESEYIWARHILLELEDEEEAKKVRDRLLDGEDFAVVAGETSTDPSAAYNAGDLGWFTEGMMVEPFADAAFALEIGEISDLVESQFGFHIIQLLGRENRPLDENDYQRARDLAFQKWLASVREESNIETFEIWAESVPTEPDLQQVLQELYGGQPVP